MSNTATHKETGKVVTIVSRNKVVVQYQDADNKGTSVVWTLPTPTFDGRFS